MNGIEKITEKILNDAKEEARGVIEIARAETEKIIEKYNEEAKSQKVKINNQAQQRKREVIKHKDDLAHLEGRKQLLTAKQAVLDEVFKEAFTKIRELGKEDYNTFLSNMASKASLNGKEEIIFSEIDSKNHGAEIVKKANQLLKIQGKNASLVLSNETRKIDGGFILKDGNIETNCTFDVLYNIARNELATEVANILF